jgi:hypothetical protein
MKHRDRQPELTNIVLALNPPGGSASGLNRGQEKTDEDRHDRNHDQKLDDRESLSLDHPAFLHPAGP